MQAIRVVRDQQEIGEFSTEELTRALADGSVNNRTDFAWQQGLEGWKRPAEIEGVSLPQDRIHVSRNDVEIGVYSREELTRAMEEGVVNPWTDYAWREGLKKWNRLPRVEGVVLPQGVGQSPNVKGIRIVALGALMVALGIVSRLSNADLVADLLILPGIAVFVGGGIYLVARGY